LERIDNYYSASCNEHTRFPELQGEHHADIAVIGGGSTGINTAVELAERGFDVIVVEANRIGWGASGRNGGQVTGSLSGDTAIHKQLQAMIGSDSVDVMRMLRWHGHKIISQRVARYNIDCDLKYGHLHTAYRPADIDQLQASLHDAQQAGLAQQVQWLDKHQVQEKLATPLYYGGVLNTYNMHLHSLNLCLGEAAAACSLGARIFEQSPVLTLEYAQSANSSTRTDKACLHTANGSVYANTIVLAGNAYVYDSRMVLDYYRLTNDRRLMFGGGTNYSGRDINDVASTLRPSLEKTFPELRGIPIEFAWTGTAGIVVNRIPAIGRVSHNVYYAQGYSGHGIASSHFMAQIVSEAISGTLQQFDLFSQLKHIRLPVGPRLGSAMIALGMAWYSLRDRIRNSDLISSSDR